jgi:hypothetical protein
MVDLRLLALELAQLLVVGTLDHDVGDLVPEHDLDLVMRGVGVFDGVVEQRCCQHHRVLDVRLHQDIGELYRVVDVGRGFGVLAALVAVLLGGEGRSLQDNFHVSGHLP